VIDIDVELTNKLTGGMVGSMTIGGVPFTSSPHARDGAFSNETKVVSEETVTSDEARIVLASTTNLSDVDGAKWIMNECHGSMEFYRAASLDGDFVMPKGEGGTFVFDEDVSTCGDLELYACNAGGFSCLDDDEACWYVGFVTNDFPYECDNPGDALEDVCGDTDGYEISDDATAYCGGE